MKKREITNNDLEQMFNTIIEQSPLVSEEQVNSLLVSLPVAKIGGAVKRFMRYYLNTLLLGATVLLIIVAAIIWVNSSSKTEDVIVENNQQRNEITPALTDTIAAKPTVLLVDELILDKALEDTVLEKPSAKIYSAVTSTDKISLTDVYKHSNKQAQIFSIQPSRDTAIVCKEGTTIKINANSFVSEKTGEETKGNVRLAVKEYYKMSDIILSNLTTTSGNKILETGGMLHITATADNDNYIIKPGGDIEIGFPYSIKKDDMELFYGEYTNDKIDWELANTAYPDDEIEVADELFIISSSEEEIETQVFVIVEEMPEFPGGDRALEKYIKQNAQYTFSALGNKIEGKVYVTFVVDKSGYPNNISVARGLDNVLDKVAVYVVSNMPKWKPGKQRGKSVNVSYTIPVPFLAKNGELTDEEINKAKLFEEKLNEFDYDAERNASFKNSKVFSELENKVKGDSLQVSDISEVNRYIFSATQLGWINCDRFYGNSNPTTNIFIPIDQADKVNVRVIFHRFKAIIPGNVESGKIAFKNIPTEEEIIIIALKTVNNKIYLATKETVVKDKEEIVLDFQQVTLDLLKKEMEKLNKLY